MRKVIFAINLSIDGCCDHTRLNGSEDIHDYFSDLLQEVDLLIYGRTTYELMVPFWPDVARDQSGRSDSMNRFANTITPIRKLVFSRTLQSVEDPNSQLLHNNLEEEVRRLKQQSGKHILLGGMVLSAPLIRLGLVDEYRIVIQPFLVGKGRRLFEDIDLSQLTQLTLAESTPLPSGALVLRYVQQP